MQASRTGLIRAAALSLLLLAGCSGRKSPVTAPVPLDEAPPETGVVLNEDFTGRQVFPADDGWNLDVSQAPVDTNSQYYIDWLSSRTPEDPGAVCPLQAHFGPPPRGLPYVGVSGSQPLVPVSFVSYPAESDAGAPGRPPGYPIPAAARSQAGYIEGNVAGGGTYTDRHLILIDRDHGLLFETWATRFDPERGVWTAGSGAVFDLANGSARPPGITSAIATGMAIFPGLVRYDEASRDAPIRHAFGVTARASYGHVWPATHTGGMSVGAPPLGLRLRLKASVDLSGHDPMLQRIFTAMKTHGLIVSGNGGCDLGVVGTMDARWNTRITDFGFAKITADDFEVVQLGWGKPAP